MADTRRGLLQGIQGRENRESAQREARTSVDTGTGSMRVPDDRREHLSRGQFINFYKDLGFATTPEHAKGIRKEEAGFQQNIQQEQGKINQFAGQVNQYRDQVNQAQSQYDNWNIPSVSKVVNDAWNKHQSSLVKVRVVDKHNNILSTHLLPADATNSFRGHRNVWATYVDGGKYFNVSSNKYDIVDSLQRSAATAAQSYKNQFFDKTSRAAASEISKANAERAAVGNTISQKRAELGQAEGQLNAAQTYLSGVKQQREKMWSDARGGYEKKLQVMEQVFSQLDVQEVKDGTAA